MLSKIPNSRCLQRQEKLFRRMELDDVDGFLVTHPPNLFYLTGFSGSAGIGFFSPQKKILWVDGRYGFQAREQSQGVRVIVSRNGVLSSVCKFFNRASSLRIGFESDQLEHATYLRIHSGVKKSIQLLALEGVVEGLRERKDQHEIKLIRRACQVTGEVLNTIKDWLRPGIRERDVAAEIDYHLRLRGAEGVAFKTIVASGPRSALPHGLPSARRLRKNDIVLIDLGAILENYCADMTRTLFLGKPNSRMKRTYERVLDAQQRAIEAVRPGAQAGWLDQLARKVLKVSDLEKSFSHSLGHGLGLEIHEAPRLARNVKHVLLESSVVTVEPGVYMPGWGGIRIEDTVLVRKDGCEILTPDDKNEWVLG